MTARASVDTINDATKTSRLVSFPDSTAESAALGHARLGDSRLDWMHLSRGT